MTKAKKKKEGRPPKKKIKNARRGRPRKTIPANVEGLISERSKKHFPRILRGMQDILPQEIGYWDWFLEKAESMARAYGFQKIILPVLEEKTLFEKTTGLGSDIIKKQMYEFRDRGRNEVALRPEFTPSVARSYIEHGMFNLSQPVKLYYSGPAFRYERPQYGRFREFHQFGLEVLGTESPAVDAQLISFSINLFRKLGLKVKFQINSLGCIECRKIYRKKLVDYFRLKKRWLCDDCQARLKQNPLRILDCKKDSCWNIIIQAPQILDSLCEDCHSHFVKVLEFLDELSIVYELTPYLVRGLDYYTKTVFQVLPSNTYVSEEKPARRRKSSRSGRGDLLESVPFFRQELGGGGRYDGLIESLGGRPTHACGISYGIERIIQEMKIQKVKIPKLRGSQIFLAQLGERAKRQALKLSEDLRKEGFKLEENFAKDSLRAQLELANKLGVKHTLILGQQEVIDKTIIIRDMTSGNQEVVDQEKIVKELRKRLK